MGPQFRLILLFFICFIVGPTAFAQNSTYRYLVLFKDKKNSPFSINKPEAFLSSKSIARRKKMNIALQTQDLPVNPSYLDQLKSTGATLIFPLKWINGALIQQKPGDLSKTLKMENVKGLYWNFPADSSANNQIKNNGISGTKLSNADPDYGSSLTQLTQLGIDVMHAKGFHGENTLITLLDNGFFNADQVSYLQAIFTEKRILGTLTTSPNLKSVYAGGSHGTNVLSTIASQSPEKLFGTAYLANFALAQTEEDDSELIVEEANWLRGAEWADSLGTDVLSSSLGYTEFDNLKQNHTYEDMNGRTTLVSKAAAWASQKGIICTISAGNEGTNAWKYISAPADADSILAVGAVDRSGLRASFSSMGPNFDKRIKPDIAAMGVGTVVGTTTGTIATSNGTSFSAPLMAGFAAGMVQANQRNTSWQIMDAIRKSGHQSAKPDQLLGYGIPNFLKATTLLNPILGIEPPKSIAIQLYPNPVKIGEKININLPEATEMKLEIINSQGIVLSTLNLKQIHQEIFLPPLSSGKYYFRFTGANSSQIIPVLYNF
jgi:hypothetical protein